MKLETAPVRDDIQLQSCPLSARAVRAIACVAVFAVRFPRASMALLLRKVMAAMVDVGMSMRCLRSSSCLN